MLSNYPTGGFNLARFPTDKSRDSAYFSASLNKVCGHLLPNVNNKYTTAVYFQKQVNKSIITR